MLEELCKYDKEWQLMAEKICEGKVDPKDIVQQMYLDIGTSNYKTFNHAFIYRVMKNIFLQSRRREKREQKYTCYVEDLQDPNILWLNY